MAGPQNYGPNLQTVKTAQQGTTPDFFNMPLDWGSLLGTMAAQGLLPLSIAQGATQTADTADQARQAAAANQAASQAGQAYTQAASAPAPPDPNNTISTSLANAASVLGGTADYRRANEDRIKQQHDELAKRRVENLTALKDNYDQQASAAERLGNTQLAGELRAKSEAQAKAAMVLIEGMKEWAGKRAQDEKDAESNRQKDQSTALALTIQQMRDEAARARAQAKTDAQAEADSNFEQFRVTTDFGDFADISKVKGVNSSKQYRDWAARTHAKLLDPKQIGALSAAEIAFANLKDAHDQIRDKLAQGPGDRLMVAGRNWLAESTGADPVLAAYKSRWSNAIQSLKAYTQQGGGPSLLRINKSEIDRAIKFDQVDEIWDTGPVADQKMANFDAMRKNGMDVTMGNDWRTPKEIGKEPWKVMGPDGQVQEMPAAVAAKLVKNGVWQNGQHVTYARVVPGTPGYDQPVTKAAPDEKAMQREYEVYKRKAKQGSK